MSDLETLADIISELVDPMHSAQTYDLLVGSKEEKRVHRIDLPSLIEQLAGEVEPGGADAGGRSVPSSRPAARIETIDRLEAIRKGANEWLDVYSPGRHRDPLRDKLKALVGEPWEPGQLHDLVTDAKRWLIWAKTITGWDSAPWRPNVPCMACNERGTLRIRLIASTAFCVVCGAGWDASTIGLLAEGIRSSNGEALAGKPA